MSCTECSAEEEEENKEQQAVELETLVSIYSEITIVEHGTEFLVSRTIFIIYGRTIDTRGTVTSTVALCVVYLW